MPNAYPELPSLPYQRTSIRMEYVIAYLQAMDATPEVKRATYVAFRLESANGQSGLNNNFIGMQGDGARWPDSLTKYFSGTTSANENQTGKSRVFMCFRTWHDSVACLAERLAARGIYVGGRTNSRFSQLDVSDPTQLARAYSKEWIAGSAAAEPSAAALANFVSMYGQAVEFFPAAAPATPSTPEPPDPIVTPQVAAAVPEDQVLRMALIDIRMLRLALNDIVARAQAALAALPAPAQPAADPDNSADDLNAQVLAGIKGDAA